jgi:hypothetical protein
MKILAELQQDNNPNEENMQHEEEDEQSYGNGNS